MAGREPRRLVPVLCGAHESLLGAQHGEVSSEVSRVWQAIELLAEEARGGKTLVVAAGDLSHVGPAFGDPDSLDSAAKAEIRSSDEEWLAAACSGGSAGLGEHIRREGDRTRICGAAPIHFMVRMLGEARGGVVHYDQCPADEGFGSLVSIAGVYYS
jgi:AmmeMemoRadiSam system protein B